MNAAERLILPFTDLIACQLASCPVGMDRDDAMQDAYEQVLRKLSAYDPQRSRPGTYFAHVARCRMRHLKALAAKHERVLDKLNTVADVRDRHDWTA